MLRNCTLAFAGLVAAFSAPALAQTAPSRFAVGLGGGTLGGSVFGEVLLNDRFVVHGQGSFLDFDHDFDTSSAHYKGSFHQNVGLGTLELHPVANPWFLAAGFVAGERKVDVTATPQASTTIKINGVTYTASQLIAVNGTADYNGAAPLLGLGWDNSLHGARKIGFRAFAGALIASDPKVSLVASGPFANDPTVQANLRAEEQNIRHDASDFDVYPVVEVGLTYRF